MWRSRSGGDTDVTCIACGDSVTRSEAREYDKEGDRWTRRDKEFEYLCKRCHGEYCHQPREGLEATLVEAGAGECDRETFLAQYHEVVGEEQERERS
jgi:hypothetical protein